MARQRQSGASEPKRRSRKGCWPCKARKVKCGEEHPACKNCVKTGDICDYSVRLNWEGRRTRRSAPDRHEFASRSAPSKQFQWHRHAFSTKNGQIVELAIEDNQGLEVGSPLDHRPKQLQSPTCASLKDAQHSLPTSWSIDGERHAGDALTFIDESLQLHLGSTDRASCLGKKRLDATKGIDLSRTPPHKVPQVDATAQNVHWRSERPLAEFAKRDIRLCQSATRSAENHPTGGSFNPLFPYPSTAGEPLTPATSSHDNHVAYHPNLNSFQPTNSAESWALDNVERREFAKQSGYLWGAFDMYGFQGPLSSFHVYPYESGRLGAFDEGDMKADLQQSAGDNAYLLSHGAYISKQSILYFGE
ncbi:hypothetical protein E4U42_002725 [Claviceps africana]|uniref:Zn(2)-C6 fungal-type domain-containing protein n=1 Tax=Claviceps africana TaxID=83212 RepID=A0A8K0NJI7_9HYPO|nr:hypothetical protein E4U42_002725 [Claviceps africana]